MKVYTWKPKFWIEKAGGRILDDKRGSCPSGRTDSCEVEIPDENVEIIESFGDLGSDDPLPHTVFRVVKGALAGRVYTTSPGNSECCGWTSLNKVLSA